MKISHDIYGLEIDQFTLSCPIFWVNHLAALSEKTLFSTNAKFQTVWLSNFLPSRFRNGTIVEINDSNTWHWIVDTVVKCNLSIMGPKFFLLVLPLRFLQKFSSFIHSKGHQMLYVICNIQIRLHRGYDTINPKEFVNNSAFNVEKILRIGKQKKKTLHITILSWRVPMNNKS